MVLEFFWRIQFVYLEAIMVDHRSREKIFIDLFGLLGPRVILVRQAIELRGDQDPAGWQGSINIFLSVQ
jgi:hypothetical protein